MAKYTKLPGHRPDTTPQPWQSWGDTARYITIVVFLVVLCIVLVWLTRG